VARPRTAALQALRYLGAVSLLLVGAIHAQQYYGDYFYVVPTIGTLFLLNFIGAGIVGAVLVAPVRMLGRNIGDLILAVASLGAIGIAAGSLVSLLVSEYTPLFGFRESGYRLAIVLSLVTDGLTIAFLGAFLLLLAAGRLRAHSAGEVTAVDRELGAGDVDGVVGGEVGDEGGDFLGLGTAA
jgi:hypothetical protein